MCCRSKAKPIVGTEPVNLNGGVHKNFLNISIIGSSGTGKTCLLRRFMGASFPELTIITTIDLLITQHIMDNGESISVRLWDTAGCERYRSLTASSIRQSEAAVLVYDESIPQTLEELITVWLPILIDGCPHLHHLLIIGNKNDKLITVDIHERITKQLELLGDRSKGHRPSFISVSAMKDDTASLQQVFRQFCSRILKHIKELDPGHYEDFLLIRN